MWVLGICHDVYLCAAAVVHEGRVMAAVAEERLDRRKLSRSFPAMAVPRVLEHAGLQLADVDEIAVAWNPSIELETVPAGNLARRWRTEHLEQVPGQLMRVLGLGAAKEPSIHRVATGLPPVTFVDHYDAHIGSGYFTSPFDEAAILVLDGRGERLTAQLAVGRGGEITSLGETRFPHSLGLFYGAVTQFLGFTPDSDEWKVMALASYADPVNELYEDLSALVSVAADGSFALDLGYFEFFNFFDRRLFSDRFVQRFGPPRERGGPLTERDHRLAAAMQRVFEETVARILHVLYDLTGLDQLVVSGGCFMNSVFNGKIPDLTPFRDVHIGSCPDDSGTSLGAALYLEARREGRKPGGAPEHNFWGPAFSDQACLDAVRRVKLPNAGPVDEPARAAAEDLVAGRVVGWFQGAMEFGQRALGHRSILLDPRRPDGKDVVNAAVKYRESFRPFAPAILAEHVQDWFECERGTVVPYMERVLPFRKEVIDRVPAVVHADGTGRLQTVQAGVNGRYHDVIADFHARTGVPLVLNTSFNLNGEPIVCTPEDAIRTFYSCGLDVLYLGNVRIAK